MLSACAATKYVPVEVVCTEYKNHTDTVSMTDTVYKEKNTTIREADPALVNELGLKLKDNERAILILQKELERAVSMKKQHTTDTVIKTDSVPVPYPVEKQLTAWQQMKVDFGELFLFIGLVLVVYLIFKFHLRR